MNTIEYMKSVADRLKIIQEEKREMFASARMFGSGFFMSVELTDNIKLMIEKIEVLSGQRFLAHMTHYGQSLDFVIDDKRKQLIEDYLLEVETLLLMDQKPFKDRRGIKG